MAMNRKFDELNNLTSDIIPITQYFEEMDLEDYDIERRIQLAERLQEETAVAFDLILSDYESVGYFDEDYVLETVENGFWNALYDREISEDEFTFLVSYIENVAKEITDSTLRHVDSDYYFSNNRATNIAENETNSIYNNIQMQEAVNSGCTMKTWISMRDKRVRATHQEVDGTTIPIDEPFTVGDSLMQFPKDDSMGASADEIVGCRCSVSYS